MPSTSADAARARLARALLRWAGAAMLVLSVVLLGVFPAEPARRNLPGVQSPIIGFELARTPGEVADLLGDPGTPERAERAARMDRGNRLDFLFLLAYAAFHAGIALRLGAAGLVPPAVQGVLLALAPVMALYDALENRELLVLSAASPSPAMADALARLRGVTLVKWYAIFAFAALAAPYVWRWPGWWRWTAPLFLVGALLGAPGAAWAPGIEYGAYVLAIAWLLTWAHALGRA